MARKKLKICMLGHKRIPSREGGIEIVVEELATRMVALGHEVTCYNRSGHHVSGKEFDQHKNKEYKGVKLKTIFTFSCRRTMCYVVVAKTFWEKMCCNNSWSRSSKRKMEQAC